MGSVREKLILVLALVALVALPLTAFAMSHDLGRPMADDITIKDRGDSKLPQLYHTEEAEQIRTEADERQVSAQARLDERRLALCERREVAIKRIMARLAERGEHHLGVFDRISARVQDFYARSGRTVETYDARLAEVRTKRAAAAAAVEAVRGHDAFSCDVNDPKGMVQAFKDQAREMIAALKEYRTAIKNLIVAVKSAQGAESRTGGGE